MFSSACRRVSITINHPADTLYRCFWTVKPAFCFVSSQGADDPAKLRES
jgi:hypothetical protein